MSSSHSMSKHHKSFDCRLCFHESLCCDRHCGRHHEIALIQNQQRIHPKKGSCRCWYPRGVALRQRGIHHHALHGHRGGLHDLHGLHGPRCGHHCDRHHGLHLRGHRDHGGDVRPSSERLPS